MTGCSALRPDVHALPATMSRPFLTVLLVWRAVAPLPVLVVFASVVRPPGLGDRRALLWLTALAVVILVANLAALWLVQDSRSHPERVSHPAAVGVDVTIMGGALLANAVVLPAESFLLEARDAFNLYVLGTAALWTYLRSPMAGLGILAVGALVQVAGIVLNGYPLEAVGTAKPWARLIWGPTAVVLVWGLALILSRAVAEQREGAHLRAEAARERAEMAALGRAHDEVLPILSEIVRTTEQDDLHRDQLDRVRRLAQQADDVVREGFHRPGAPGGELRAGIAELVHQSRERQRAAARPARVQLFCESGEPLLPPYQRKALLAASDQALRNAEQHAQANTIQVSIEADDDQVRVVVSDDGVGFDPQAVTNDRFGIRGSIQARMDDVGGRAVLDTAPQQGCVWELVVRHGPAPPPESGVAE